MYIQVYLNLSIKHEFEFILSKFIKFQKLLEKLVMIKPNRISDYSEVREVNTSKNRIAKPI